MKLNRLTVKGVESVTAINNLTSEEVTIPTKVFCCNWTQTKH